MTKTQTTFGTVELNEHGTTLHASGDLLADWANRGDCRWPCSRLADLEWLKVDFDAKGDLVDIESNLSYEEWEVDGPDASELNAWSSETLHRAGYPNHPAIRS